MLSFCYCFLSHYILFTHTQQNKNTHAHYQQVTYAIIVLRLGIVSTFLTPLEDHQCVSQSLFNAARSHVIFTAMAWFMILFGYVLPFSIALLLLTRNGYSPSIDGGDGGDHQGQFGGGVITLGTSNGAPLGTVDAMKRIEYEDLSEEHPRECCVSFFLFLSNSLLSYNFEEMK